ncbi:GSCFA domain-containing protein [Pseudotamlana carrageenivorans]|uniref:GSCFA domain-containing protein n=1 Tax=Pseudotamlana carrageenivorans TaxID=2069432 RepID=A0A2I7SEI2_9FLAO|nr:GSCFA domain-containing protein [Tamlana carrageenivorans]AUS04311.1 GSCFA domain-containing protein [Tamlana carrageenivorans]
MNLQTKIPLKKSSSHLIDYSSKVFLMGSCFSENIGDKLTYFKFQTKQNPFGIFFHPLAIHKLISRAISSAHYNDADVLFHNEQWHGFDAHSKLSNVSKEQLLKTLNTRLQETYNDLKSASHLVITLGTAWVYRYKETNQVVANCHKIPQKQFSKSLLSVHEIVEVLKSMEAQVRRVNEQVSIIYTVSPVRHLKDGFVENNRSKAHLTSAIHQFLDENEANMTSNSFYFPSYEIMMDELRDYRFYAEDMVHPNALAIQYIWNAFVDTWISKNALKTMDVIDGIQKSLQHRPFNEKSEAHQKFLQKLESKIVDVKNCYPYMSF